MIIKIHASGKSFKGLVQYLGHDPKADSKERLAWTHTLNCAHDLPALALDEIYWTFRAAEALKQEAGVRRGGRRTETPVKHISLSWDPEDGPGKAHMIATVESFLKHMRWAGHQAILYCHNDTDHPHVHIVLNAVHPDTGLKLDEGNDWKRAEPWGLQYELERGDVKCRQRLLHPDERTPTPTRETWQQLRGYEREDTAYEAGRVSGNWDYLDRKSPEQRRDREWQALKEHQRQEREAFFAGGKAIYREAMQGAYRQVRAAFKAEWKDYFAAERDGLAKAVLTVMKEDLMARQKAALDAERDKDVKIVRAQRDKEYGQLLAGQRAQRRELRQAQEQGRTYTPLDLLHAVPRPRERDQTVPERMPRSPSPIRETWEALRAYDPTKAGKDKQHSFLDRPTARDRARQERNVLRDQQQAEREDRYARGKLAYRAARKEARDDVADEMRPTWQAIRQAKAAGHSRTPLTGLRHIRLRQHKEMARSRMRVAVLTEKTKHGWERDEQAALHKAERHTLRHRQLNGLRTYRVVDRDRALVSSDEAAKAAQEQAEARQKGWRQTRPEPVATMAPLESEAARFTAALRVTRERSAKMAEHQDRVRQAWRRIRPGPGRGRD